MLIQLHLITLHTGRTIYYMETVLTVWFIEKV